MKKLLNLRLFFSTLISFFFLKNKLPYPTRTTRKLLNQHRSLGSNYQNPSTFLNKKGIAVTKLAKLKLSHHQIKSTIEWKKFSSSSSGIYPQGRAWYEFSWKTSCTIFYKSAKSRYVHTSYCILVLGTSQRVLGNMHEKNLC